MVLRFEAMSAELRLGDGIHRKWYCNLRSRSPNYDMAVASQG